MTSKPHDNAAYNPLENMLLNVGRMLLAVMPLIIAFDKFNKFDRNVELYNSLGLPMPETLVWLTIGLGLLVTLMIIFGFGLRFAVVLIGLFVLLDASLVRIVKESLATEWARYIFSMDLAILGGCLAYLVTGPGAWSIMGRR